MVKIGIDGRAFQGNRTGIGRFSVELCKRLDIEFPEAEFFVYTNKEIEIPCNNSRWHLRYDRSFIGKIKPVMWTKFGAGRLCSADNIDFFWGTTTFLPRLSKRVKTVVTIYDFNCILVPETMKMTHYFAHRLFFKKDILHANRRIVISKGTAEKLSRFFGVDADEVINPAADERFRIYSKEEITNVKTQLHLSDKYILAVGTLEPRKNLTAIIDAFIDLRKQGKLKEFKLVIVGGKGWNDKKIVDKVNSIDQIIRLGYVEDQILPILYSGAEMFVFPSIYEGYGMPVLEALKCGTKVVTSDIPEIREIQGDGRVVYVTPTLNEIKDGILKALELDLSKGGSISSHTWEDDGKKLAKVFQSLL